MTEKTNEELYAILEHADEYRTEVVNAVKQELLSRGVDISGISELESKTYEKEPAKKPGLVISCLVKALYFYAALSILTALVNFVKALGEARMSYGAARAEWDMGTAGICLVHALISITIVKILQRFAVH